MRTASFHRRRLNKRLRLRHNGAMESPQDDEAKRAALSEKMRALNAKRKTHAGGRGSWPRGGGRPPETERCTCGEHTAARAIKRNMKCAPGYAPDPKAKPGAGRRKSS